jgi:anthranilate synthase component 1
MRPRVSTADLGRWVDPEAAWAAVCAGADAAFWLDSGPSATTGMSYLGVAVEAIVDPDEFVLEWLAARLRESADVDTSAAPTGFRLGWVGWLGYELRAETMGTPRTYSSRYPDAAWMRVDTCLVFDHARGSVHVMTLGDAGAERDRIRALIDAAPALVAPRPPVATTVVWADTDEHYLGMVRACQDAIRAGDAYQLCLTTEARVPASPDPFDTYRLLRAASPTHHGALLVVGELAVLGASPERFLAVTPDGVVTTSPIKGTRRRGDTPLSDALLRDELVASDKERAENLMIVDLMRNDLTRVCRVGSVGVTSLLEVESYAQVHQLVSTVRGELAEGLTGLDAIRSCFPAGSMTGAPKHSATLILDRLERRARGIYSGALGYLGLDGAVDLAMVIRSIVIDPTGSTVGTGGGITALSLPEDELAETRIKARALLQVLGAPVAVAGFDSLDAPADELD